MGGEWKLMPVEPTRDILDAIWMNITRQLTENGEDRDAIKLYDSVLAASPAPPSGSAWGVKELEWVEEVTGMWWLADSYRIEVFDGGGFAARVAAPPSRAFKTLAHGVTFEAAKAAAQADYEARIRSALTPSPSYAEGLTYALNTALVAMRLASRLPGVADEYDFEPAIAEVTNALAGKPPAEGGARD